MPNFLENMLDRIVGKTPEPPRAQPPKTPDVITPGTAQYALAQAQDEARNNPAFKYSGTPGDPTFCNIATYDIVKRMGGPVQTLEYDKGKAALANQAAHQLAKDSLLPSGRWRGVDTPVEAQNLANQGVVVVGVQQGTRDENGNRKHGHMVTVRPELTPGFAADNQHQLASSGKSAQFTPVVNNIGSSISIEPAANVFHKSEPILYYTPR
jgi:hypothetical protein